MTAQKMAANGAFRRQGIPPGALIHALFALTLPSGTVILNRNALALPETGVTAGLDSRIVQIPVLCVRLKRRGTAATRTLVRKMARTGVEIIALKNSARSVLRRLPGIAILKRPAGLPEPTGAVPGALKASARRAVMTSRGIAMNSNRVQTLERSGAETIVQLLALFVPLTSRGIVQHRTIALELAQTGAGHIVRNSNVLFVQPTSHGIAMNPLCALSQAATGANRSGAEESDGAPTTSAPRHRSTRSVEITPVSQRLAKTLSTAAMTALCRQKLKCCFPARKCLTNQPA